MSPTAPAPPTATHRNYNAATEPPPTVASFSPTSTLQSHTTHRSTILVHQKSPLLIATPPQITRALAYSHPFILPLNHLAGLLSWTTGDAWESFLLVACFWATVLYGDLVARWAGPVVFGVTLILTMYSRRYSPLSSTSWINQTRKRAGNDSSEGEAAAAKHKRKESDGMRHHKSLDEIVAALQLFTARCNILLDPFLRLTDFLSTQRTATSATTRPALTAFFLRVLMLLPVWWCLTLPPAPWRLLSTRRVVLALGTVALSWHSRPARVSRAILWRSRTVRRIVAIITGLSLSPQTLTPTSSTRKTPRQPNYPPKTAHEIATSLAARRSHTNGAIIPPNITSTPHDPKSSAAPPESICFTFTLYENQRRWLGIGWTSSMLAYERAAWTDEHLNPVAPKDKYKLPEVEGGVAKWRWAEDSAWEVDMGSEDEAETHRGDIHRKRSRGGSSASTSSKVSSAKSRADEDEARGWVFYDNKWLHGRRGVDGWGRYTRRRRWVRDAELVELDPAAAEHGGSDATPVPSPRSNTEKGKDGASHDPDLLSPSLAASMGGNEGDAGGGKGVDREGGRDGASPLPAAKPTPDASPAAEPSHRHRMSWFSPRRHLSRRSRSGSGESHASTTPSVASGGAAGAGGLRVSTSGTHATGVLAGDNEREGAAGEAAGAPTVSGRSSVGHRRNDSEDDGYVPLRFRGRQGAVESDWGVGEDLGMELG